MTASPASETQTAEARRGSEFAELSRRIKSEGLLHRRHTYYALRIGTNLALLAAGVVAFVLLGDSWWQMLTAAGIAVVLTQFAFIGHDAGHRQIFQSRRGNDVIGYAHGAITGISYQWWVSKHNRHHANPNHEDEDPDIDILVLAFTDRQATTKRGVAHFITKYQAFLFFPLLLVEAIMLRIASFQAVLAKEIKTVRLEGTLLVVHTVVYLGAVFTVLSPGKALVFIAIHQGLMGVYLGCSFAPNHKGMPVLSKDDAVDFLRKQVLTSRNIIGGRWVDYLFGGLNYQIEHHLFPNMPRANLRRAQPIVQEYCTRQGIPYVHCGIFASYRQVLSHLHSVGATLRTPALANS
ncbi:fatty acid desaturase family protein [Actinokineospora globicatena]|uniref:fatty acid desaturase family protein n=1 Tax=Actinokineospora globicatena TaxID=103729 RepID=UPI0020A44342|nr:acyl-CoA desaturase [Actinokineospora globicatena]MCP2306782.1 Fatty acid desaturase [Actinokineospora globicatena]GLW82095.1 fatty acid desaturase [Actinokineospora globicatena]GLW88888.1 fatty acid desaturase [Actinokineospora globicatena]